MKIQECHAFKSSRTFTTKFMMATEIVSETLHGTADCPRGFSAFSRLEKRGSDIVIQ